MAAAENALLESRQRPQGLLRVDAATPVVLHLLTPLVAEFRERYPEMSLSLVSSENFINLIERKVDIAIRVGELTDSTLKARKLMASYRRIWPPRLPGAVWRAKDGGRSGTPLLHRL